MSSSLSERSIPLRWPSAWTTPALLELIKTSPIDCLLDAPEPVAAAARDRGIAVVTHDQASSAVQFLADPQWPGMRAGRRKEGADSGPTGSPWIDANGWSIRLARALDPGKPVWVDAAPAKGTVQNNSSYLLAIAESAASGARWVVNLDDAFAKGVASADGPMTARWQAMMDAIRFFESRRSWAALEPRSNLALISDFSGANEFLGRELLNMADRRNLPYRVVPKRSAANGLNGPPADIVYVDEQAPDAALAAALKTAAQNGSLLIASRQSGIAGWGQAAAPSAIPGYEVKNLGKGRIAVPAKPWDDPYVLAAEVRILTGRRSDVLRLYNAGSLGAAYVRSKDGNNGVIHLLNYTRRPVGDLISVAPSDEYSRAQVVSLERPQGELVKIAPRPERFNEIPVRSFAVYSAVELWRAKEG